MSNIVELAALRRPQEISSGGASEVPSSRDLHITTVDMQRTPISNLPPGIEVLCTRTNGWQVYKTGADERQVLIAGERESPQLGLRLDVAGFVIVDSLS